MCELTLKACLRSYLVGWRSKALSDPSSTSIPCACVKQRLWLDCIMPMLAWAIAARWCDVYQNLFVLALLCLLLDYHTLCMQNAKTLAKLCKCLGLYEPSLLINAISDQNLLCWLTLYHTLWMREGKALAGLRECKARKSHRSSPMG